MGMFQVAVGVANPHDPNRFFEERFWVDTGALYSFAPGERLEQIGIAARWTRELILADGRRERCSLGEAVFTIPDLHESLTCLVVFGPPGSLCLLGATALENFGVEADPANQRLKRIAAIIGGFRATTVG